MILYKIQKLLLLAIFLLSASELIAAAEVTLYQEAGSDVSFDSVLGLEFTDANNTVAYGDENTELQYGMLWLPETGQLNTQDKAPLIVFIHGGCWLNEYDIRHTFPFSSALAQAGYAVWSLEYRRTGDLGGGWPGTFDDIVEGIAFVETMSDYPIDTDQVIIAGHSAGGHLALLAGSQFAEAKAVIGLAAITDVASYSQGNNSCQSATAGFMGTEFKDDPEVYRQANPKHKTLHSNTFLLHGTSDAIVPPSQAQLANTNTQLLEGAGHFDWIHPGTGAFKHLLGSIGEILTQ